MLSAPAASTEADAGLERHRGIEPFSLTMKSRSNSMAACLLICSTMRLLGGRELLARDAGDAFGWCQRRDLNPRPKAYESSALPLSYSGNPMETSDSSTSRLHAGTVADAVAARQVLKAEIKSGKFLTPPEAEAREREDRAKKVSTEAGTRTLKEAVAGYQADRNALGAVCFIKGAIQ